MKAEPIGSSITEPLPALPLRSWSETLATLHMWLQIVGKVQMKLTPKVNHWWNVALRVTSRGLTTPPIPYGFGSFEIAFDFLEHKLVIELSDGNSRALPLRPQSVAEFYQEFMPTLASLGVNVKIWTMPVEIPDPIRFEADHVHASYDADAAQRFWRILVWVDKVFEEFRSRFIGKVSPVHFFWGSFDLAVTRFSGRPAPQRPGADPVTREAYSHEVSSAGFWPGGGEIAAPAFYSYAAPQPEGFASRPVRPRQAFYHSQLGEFLLMYDDVRNATSPKDSLLEFLQSTYEAAAILGNWDRKALER
ncbi:MAG: DUF5996 family protein [Candidatus Korobacteraceae bacterium]|jgi:hypothetical protein